MKSKPLAYLFETLLSNLKRCEEGLGHEARVEVEKTFNTLISNFPLARLPTKKRKRLLLVDCVVEEEKGKGDLIASMSKLANFTST